MRPGGIAWDTATLLLSGGKTAVVPTKVGYIIMTADCSGLERKFEMKERPKSKPGVVLCSSVEQIKELAHINDNIERLYQYCWAKDILLGCILPWRTRSAVIHIPDDGSNEMIMDERGTSCFVIKYGDPSERVAESLWENHGKLAFASSANPSGKGNRGKLQYVGDKILQSADSLVFADDYVERQQPDKTMETRWEQGVMVSMVDDSGLLVDNPVVIRRGLSLDKILFELSTVYDSFDYRHGAYH